MSNRRRIGMLTPSSNTVLEPVTAAMLRDLPEVSVHFGRFRVTRISLDAKGLGQFDEAPMMTAATLLADAKVDLICWNGTSAGWLGFETDRALCARIAAETGIPAITTVLALAVLLKATGETVVGLVTPYTDDVQARIVETFAREGLRCVAERHLGISGIFAFGEVTPARLEAMVAAVARTGAAQAIVPFCTNLGAAPLAAAWEARFGVPVYDTVAVTLWKALRVVGIDPRRVGGWGRLFEIHDL